uniref:Exonuclease 1 n=1 Tax=Parastrongyloides trichosuri TaxID=131310 RepID=A0A0N4ZG78_PARTI
MGIPDLLRYLDKAKQKNVNIVQFSGRTLAVDTSCFLYKGLYAQAYENLHGIQSTKCIDYLEKTAKIITNAGIHAIFVFDGRTLPSKKLTNDKRLISRNENREKAFELLKIGDKEGALKNFKRSFYVTKELQEDCIKALRGMKNVDILVAPYEADAQLAFLVKEKLAYGVVTVDSDLIPFGCERIIYNLNVDSAMCEVIESSRIKECVCVQLQSTFDLELLRYMCILKGCDYFGGLKGFAYKTAEKFFSKISNRTPKNFIKHIRSITKLKIENLKEFFEEFTRANNTFLYQIVYDPRDGCQKPLNPYPEELLNELKNFKNTVETVEEGNHLWYAGNVVSKDVAKLLAIGNNFEDIIEEKIKFDIPENLPLNSIWKSLVDDSVEVKLLVDDSINDGNRYQNPKKRKCTRDSMDSECNILLKRSNTVTMVSDSKEVKEEVYEKENSFIGLKNVIVVENGKSKYFKMEESMVEIKSFSQHKKKTPFSSPNK